MKGVFTPQKNWKQKTFAKFSADEKAAAQPKESTLVQAYNDGRLRGQFNRAVAALEGKGDGEKGGKGA